jgi:glutaredoxin
MTNQIDPRSCEIKLYRMSTPEHVCPWGLKAVQLFQDRGLDFADIKLESRQEVDAFKAKYQVETTPQIFFDSERIGGYENLVDRLQSV